MRSAVSPASRARAFSSSSSGRVLSTKAVWSASSSRVLARSLTNGMARSSRASSPSFSAEPLRQVGVERHAGQTVVVGQPQPVGVDVGQLVEVQPGRRLADAVEVEPLLRLLVAEQLVVAVGPAQPGQIVAHGLGQIAHLGVLMDRLGAVAFRQLGAVGAVDQRDVGEGRPGPAQRVVDQALARGVVQVVVAADDVGHAHVVVVDDHGQIVGRRAVGAQQDQIVQIVRCPS